MTDKEMLQTLKVWGIAATITALSAWGWISCQAKNHVPATPKSPTPTEKVAPRQYQEPEIEKPSPQPQEAPKIEKPMKRPERTLVVEANKRPIRISLEAYADYTAPFEGIRTGVYDPNPRDDIYEPTIGVGFYMLDDNAREDFTKALPGIDFDKVLLGEQKLTKGQAQKLFALDLPIYEAKARRLFRDFDSYPEYLRQALFDTGYQGTMGPKTRKLINEGKWDEVAEEYLDHNGYKTAKERGMLGIKTRMDENASRMNQYSEELKADE
jgi:hypothetical protein